MSTNKKNSTEPKLENLGETSAPPQKGVRFATWFFLSIAIAAFIPSAVLFFVENLFFLFLYGLAAATPICLFSILCSLYIFFNFNRQKKLSLLFVLGGVAVFVIQTIFLIVGYSMY